MNYNSNRGPKPASRPLLGGMPEYIAVEITESEYKRQLQWAARYKLYNNGLESDFIDIVVNFPRGFGFSVREEGTRLWVKPTAMAPQKRLIFAEAFAQVRDHDVPLTVRTGEELVLEFNWSKRDRHYWTLHDNWKVVVNHANGICLGEKWRVLVERIDPASGLIETSSIGPDPRTDYRPPDKVALMSVIPIFDCHKKYGVVDGELMTYEAIMRRYPHGSWKMRGEFVHEGRVVRFECTELRVRKVYGKGYELVDQIVGFVVLNRYKKYLAELVLVDGGMAPAPLFDDTPTSRLRSTTKEPEELDDPHGEDILAEEYRANVDRRDYGYD